MLFELSFLFFGVFYLLEQNRTNKDPTLQINKKAKNNTSPKKKPAQLAAIHGGGLNFDLTNVLLWFFCERDPSIDFNTVIFHTQTHSQLNQRKHHEVIKVEGSGGRVLSFLQ